MFWIIILPLNILYYPTKESIRFSNNLIFLTVLRFIVISATFCQVFAGFSPAFGLGLGAVLGISAVSAIWQASPTSFLPCPLKYLCRHIPGDKKDISYKIPEPDDENRV